MTKPARPILTRHLTPAEAAKLAAEAAEMGAARKRIDRSLAWSALGIHPRKRKKPSDGTPSVGHPREYDHAAICRVTEAYIAANGLPPTQALLRSAVRVACDSANIRVPEDTQLKKITGPIFRQKKP
jgi:hypothetical protein